MIIGGNQTPRDIADELDIALSTVPSWATTERKRRTAEETGTCTPEDLERENRQLRRRVTDLEKRSSSWEQRAPSSQPGNKRGQLRADGREQGHLFDHDDGTCPGGIPGRLTHTHLRRCAAPSVRKTRRRHLDQGMKESHKNSRRIYGAPRMTADLRAAG